jgi:hypothetical protein
MIHDFVAGFLVTLFVFVVVQALYDWVRGSASDHEWY